MRVVCSIGSPINKKVKIKNITKVLARNLWQMKEHFLPACHNPVNKLNRNYSMTKNYKEITNTISTSLSKMRKEIPDVMNGFNALAQAATKEGALSKKTKELIALALGIASH